MIPIGTALSLKIPFADGGECKYKRPFLVINFDQSSNNLTLLNASTIKNKVHKTVWNSNKVLTNHNPPFPRPTFVKLDSIYKVEYFSGLDNMRMMSGRTLDSIEFQKLLIEFENYQDKVTVSFSQKEIATLNQLV